MIRSPRPFAIVCAAALLVATGCASEPRATDTAESISTRPPREPAAVAPPEAWSLFGRPLERPALSEEARAERQANLDAALAVFDEHPTDEDAIIWVGRRQAYLGRYRDAIVTFTRGLETHPDAYLLRRHRGHRFITIRRFRAAISDLDRAAELVESRNIPDEVEPDGLPNALNLPRSTSHSNIYYHLGLAHYVSGDFESARRAYEQCMSYCYNDDMLCATSYWLYLTQRRLGLDDDARAVLEPIHSRMDVIENTTYMRLLLLFKGDLTIDELLDGRPDDDIQEATMAYGIGAWHLLNGDDARAEGAFRRLTQTDAWAAFGYIAAEAGLWRRAR